MAGTPIIVLTMKAWAPLKRTSSPYLKQNIRNFNNHCKIYMSLFLLRVFSHSYQEEQVALAFCIPVQIKTGRDQGLLDNLRRQLSLKLIFMWEVMQYRKGAESRLGLTSERVRTMSKKSYSSKS